MVYPSRHRLYFPKFFHHQTSPSQVTTISFHRHDHRSSRFNSPHFNLHLSFPCHSPTLSTSISLPFSFCTTTVIPPLVFLPVGFAGSRIGIDGGIEMENKRGVDEMKLERGRCGFGIDGEDNRSACGEVLCGIDGFPSVECYGVLTASFTFQISSLLLWLSAMERTAGMNYKDG
ncbi:hypothetical protein L6452_25053 [Arctium lappa]|uniref:Uncharacterized protein n=1 Tax=Arctium lappa TaxID=4217 RepID=A0ACB9A9Q1_ARCLA|nr:hypothetical protein L6452_25053 [Arctium lappa]